MPDTPDGRIILARLEEGFSYIRTQVDKILDTIERISDRGAVRDKRLTEICAVIAGLPEFEKRLKIVEDEVVTFRPWVHGLRWFVLIFGGVLALAVIGGILWAVAQSGGIMP